MILVGLYKKKNSSMVNDRKKKFIDKIKVQSRVKGVNEDEIKADLSWLGSKEIASMVK